MSHSGYIIDHFISQRRPSSQSHDWCKTPSFLTQLLSWY